MPRYISLSDCLVNVLLLPLTWKELYLTTDPLLGRWPPPQELPEIPPGAVLLDQNPLSAGGIDLIEVDHIWAPLQPSHHQRLLVQEFPKGAPVLDVLDLQHHRISGLHNSGSVDRSAPVGNVSGVLKHILSKDWVSQWYCQVCANWT